MARTAFPDFGKRLRGLFEQRGLTNQSAFARDHGFAPAKISRWLRGALPESQADFERLGAALEVDWRWLLVGEYRPKDAGTTGMARSRQDVSPAANLTAPEGAMDDETFRQVWARVGLVWKHRKERPVQWEALVKNVQAFSLGLDGEEAQARQAGIATGGRPRKPRRAQ